MLNGVVPTPACLPRDMPFSPTRIPAAGRVNATAERCHMFCRCGIASMLPGHFLNRHRYACRAPATR